MAVTPPRLTGSPPPLKKRSGNKGWLAAALILLLLAAIMAVYAPFMLGSRDLPEPPDDRDLQSRAVEIPSRENAWAYYVLAVNAVDMSEQDEERLYELEETDEASAVVLDELVEKNALAFEYYRQAIAAPRSQAPILASYNEDLGIEDVYTGDLLTLVYKDFRRRFFDAEELEALKEALEMAQLGSKLMHSHGIGHFYSEGTYVLYYGLDEIIKLVAQSDLPAEQLRSFSGALGTLYDDGSGLAGALREDYPLLAAHLLEITNIEIAEDEEIPAFLRKLGELVERQAANAYHINRMRTDLVESLRPLIANAGRPLSEMPLEILSEAENMGFSDGLSAIRPKGMSRLMVLQMLPFLRDPIEEKCETNSLIAIAQATLALKLYHIEHGALPASLNELVPEYLDRVPLDDMDGQPLRYDPARKILYSIGLDLVDTGGSDPEIGYDGDDPAWSVDFEPNTETTDGDTTN